MLRSPPDPPRPDTLFPTTPLSRSPADRERHPGRAGEARRNRSGGAECAGPRHRQVRKAAVMKRLLPLAALLGCLALLLVPGQALAQALTFDLGADTAGTTTGRIIQLIALITILSLAPSILVMMTSFTRLVVEIGRATCRERGCQYV